MDGPFIDVGAIRHDLIIRRARQQTSIRWRKMWTSKLLVAIEQKIECWIEPLIPRGMRLPNKGPQKTS
ncbi:MAG: hypothetical protein CMM16_01635 [Rhodospirillaceae bacterium]|nr:hypothetical protein [Rhodospirillaceae bacterium]